MGNKYGYNGAGGMGGGMQNLMKQAQQMQQKLLEAQAQLEETEVTGSASGGMVSVNCNCKKTITAISIRPEAVDPDDVEMLEDLILAAVNDAYTKAQAEEDRLMAPFAAMKGLM
ncbi:MAG: YbaB/EbfC family nucleoid-associated protein [Corallococcus sp.]|nr:YbaB/EbfC family nucleoid-associated protein [Corallococcus sp.]